MNYCALARQSLQHWLAHHRPLVVNEREGRRAGCFVSLHDAAGELRGCIGTILPNRDDLLLEIVENAISAGTRDPRFSPVLSSELPSLVFEVSVLADPEPVNSQEELDHRRYGVIVENGYRRGVLLPDLEGVRDVDHQLEIASRKAGIGADEEIKVWRFEVVKHHE